MNREQHAEMCDRLIGIACFSVWVFFIIPQLTLAVVK